MYYIPQVSKSSCGFTCLKMLLAIAHKDERYLYLKEDESHGPYSYQDLVVIAQRHEVTLIGVKYDDKGDLRHIKDFPLILTINRGNESSHAVLVTKRRGKRIFVQDPDLGTKWWKIDKFISLWDGTALAINHVKEKPFTLRVIDVKDIKSEIISYFLQALTASFIALATMFVKPEGSFLWPLLFCALSLVSEIILRLFLLKRMQKCDRYLRRFLPYVEKKDYFEYYKRSQEYKRSALTIGLNFVFSLIVVALISAIALVNSLTFIILIGIAFISALTEVFFFTPFKENMMKSVNIQEDKLMKIKDEEEMEKEVKSMEVKSYRLAYLIFASKIFYCALFILASFIVGAIVDTITLPSIAFYTCLSFLLYQHLVPIFSYDYKVSENRMKKAQINNLIHQNDEINRKRG